jgi:hypothetical protein
MSIALKPNDAAWMFIEKLEQPCHVACLAVFSPPADAGPDYLRKLVQQFESTRVFPKCRFQVPATPAIARHAPSSRSAC